MCALRLIFLRFVLSFEPRCSSCTPLPPSLSLPHPHTHRPPTPALLFSISFFQLPSLSFHHFVILKYTNKRKQKNLNYPSTPPSPPRSTPLPPHTTSPTPRSSNNPTTTTTSTATTPHTTHSRLVRPPISAIFRKHFLPAFCHLRHFPLVHPSFQSPLLQLPIFSLPFSPYASSVLLAPSRSPFAHLPFPSLYPPSFQIQSQHISHALSIQHGAPTSRSTQSYSGPRTRE